MLLNPNNLRMIYFIYRWENKLQGVKSHAEHHITGSKVTYGLPDAWSHTELKKGDSERPLGFDPEHTEMMHMRAKYIMSSLMFILDVDTLNKLECVWHVSPKHENNYKLEKGAWVL